jgi:branched-chain amino acid transport system ATP-binding protein
VAFLEVADVTKRFGGLVALNAISFSVEKGEIVGIIGPNGAGKTTLFGVISGFIAPSQGDVSYDGESIIGISPDRLVRRGLMRSFQIVQSFADMTALDVVTTAALTRRPMREAIDYAAEALVRVGLGGKERQMPLTLSLQDKKLLELAKCIATDPRCILLDEVMAGLTMSETAKPIAVIQELNRQGVTIVMVEHVMEAIRALCGHVVVMNAGVKIAEGTAAEVLSHPKVTQVYLGEEDAAA